MKKIFKILSTLLLVISFIILVGAIMFVFTPSSKKQKTFFLGYKPFFVATGSMEPNYKINSLVIIKKVNFDSVKVGDNIAFESVEFDNKLVFHRVVEKKKNSLVTKGDNNQHNDQYEVSKEKLVGIEKWHTNITVTIIDALSTPKGIVLFLVLPIVSIILAIIGFKLLHNLKIDAKKNS